MKNTKSFKLANKRLIKARMLELDISEGYIAAELGISVSALRDKIDGRSQFKANEIYIFSKILLVQERKDDYFFSMMSTVS